MTKEETLADLRKQFGPNKSVLYAVELAQVLDVRVKGIYDLKDRGGLPFPILPGTGRPCVSIHAVVDWLHGEARPIPKQKKIDPKAPAPVPPPKRRRESMAAYLTTLRHQMDFLNELYSELERLDMLAEIDEGQKSKSDRR